MKSEKIFSIILSLSLIFSGMSFCFAEESTRNFDKKAFYDMKKWAGKYSNKCKLDSNNDCAQCTFDDKGQEITVIKYKTGEYVVSNSTDTFANYKGDNVWLYNGKVRFYELNDGLVEPKALDNLVARWGGLSRSTKRKLKSLCKDDIMRVNFVGNVSSFWSWWYVPIVGALAWVGNLIYKNYKLFTGKKNANTQAQQTQPMNYPVYYYVDPNYFQQGNQGLTQPKIVQKDAEIKLQTKEEIKKDEKPSDTESIENKESVSNSEEDSSKTEEKSSKIEENILKDVTPFTIN